MKRPVVLVTARQMIRKDRLIDFIGEVHLELLMSMGILPVIVPVSESTLDCLPQYIDMMDGLLLAEGDDIDPHRFAARKSIERTLEVILPLRRMISISRGDFIVITGTRPRPCARSRRSPRPSRRRSA